MTASGPTLCRDVSSTMSRFKMLRFQSGTYTPFAMCSSRMLMRGRRSSLLSTCAPTRSTLSTLHLVSARKLDCLYYSNISSDEDQRPVYRRLFKYGEVSVLLEISSVGAFGGFCKAGHELLDASIESAAEHH